MNFVLDASVTLSWAFEDEAEPEAEAVLERLRTGEALVPALWGLEVANGLIMAERRGRIEPVDASRFLSLLAALPIVVEPPDRRRALDAIPRLARAHRLSSYDATYLDLALRYGLELATRDQVLRAAAEREGVAMRAP